MALMHHAVMAQWVAMGALVAVLPRSLQLFQTMHASNMGLGQAVFHG
jgi:hypothetical protein